MKTVKCPCGARSVEFEDTCGNVGATKTASGFFPAWDQANGLEIIWLCPACAEQAKVLAAELVKLVGSRHVYLGNLLPKEERK
jgi:hypothetical protein